MFPHKVNKQRKTRPTKAIRTWGRAFVKDVTVPPPTEWDSVAMDGRRDEASCHPLGFALHAGIA